MNIFCTKDCAGGDIQEVKECDDVYCPFYQFRYMSLDWQNRRKKSIESSRKEIQ